MTEYPIIAISDEVIQDNGCGLVQKIEQLHMQAYIQRDKAKLAEATSPQFAEIVYPFVRK